MKKVFPPLYKRTATGAVQEWNIRVESDGDKGRITIIQGQQGGKKQIYCETIEKGKNLGRANATTAIEQAIAEAQSRWEKQRDRKHYGLTVEESADKREEAPMLAQKYEDHAKKVEWKRALAQPKLDGNRCIARYSSDGTMTLWTRKGVQIKTMDHIADELTGLMNRGETFDGELYVHGLHVTNLRSLLTRAQEGCKQVSFRVYDMVKPLPFHTRFSELEDRLGDRIDAPRNGIALVQTIRVMNEKELMTFQKQCIEQGFEGAMLRWGEAGYEAGKRSHGLLKVKTFQDAEFQIVDVVDSKKPFNLCREDGQVTPVKVAVFVCVTADGHQFNVTAPGTIAEKHAILHRPDDYVGKSLTVKFQCYTATDKPVPFQPVAKEVRED